MIRCGLLKVQLAPFFPFDEGGKVDGFGFRTLGFQPSLDDKARAARPVRWKGGETNPRPWPQGQGGSLFNDQLALDDIGALAGFPNRVGRYPSLNDRLARFNRQRSRRLMIPRIIEIKVFIFFLR